VDILNLVDELDIHELIKETSVALEDEDMLREFIRDKAMMALERFLVGHTFTTIPDHSFVCAAFTHHLLNFLHCLLPSGLHPKNVNTG
jgi:hypothetical protein